MTDINNRTSPQSTPAIGDIDNDGQPEIITLEEDRPSPGYVSEHLIAFEHDGTWKWTSDPAQMRIDGSPAIADLDADGTPEIVVGDQVFNNLGHLIATGGAGGKWDYSCVANVEDLVGGSEIIAGNTVYSYSSGLLNVEYYNASLGDGLNAIGNFDDDPQVQAEIVLVEWGAKVYLLEHNLERIWGPTILPDGGGGPPTIADYDGDGFPDIGVASTKRYTVFNRTGDILWEQNITDSSSGCAGSTVFDLNCDGVKDVIYRDERNLTIFDGRNGAIQWRTLTSSITGREYPIVADVDNDGYAEIVVSCDEGHQGSPYFYGIRVFENDTNWSCARKIWNQHSYHITNINDDGTVPPIEVNSWEDNNNYRVQDAGGGVPKICCPIWEGIFWNNVIPGSVVNSSFWIWNCGDNCSELDWEVTEWPDWGGQPWIFIPKEGHNLRQCTDPITIDVYVWAPNKLNWGWTGHITICNKDDPSDCCSVPVSLTTPRNMVINTSFLNFLQNHPNMFPILQRLLHRLGLQ